MRTIKIGQPLIELQSVDSTNVYAMQLIRNSKVTEGTVILTGYQTLGKGHGNNRWISDEGRNLLFSLIIMPDFMLAERQFYLSMCVSNAILEFIQPVARPVTIKWPNDILLDGKKVAGILIENTVLGQNLHTSVIGIGMNVNQQEFPPDLVNSTSLTLAAGKDFNLSDLLKQMLASLELHLNRLYEERYGETRTYYLNHLYRLHEWAEFSDSTGIFRGRIADIADTGKLIVMKENGTECQYGFKEIAFR